MRKMLQKGFLFFSIFILTLMPMFSSGASAFAEAQERDEAELQLYRVIEPFELAEGIFVAEQTLFFGSVVSEEDTILIQHQFHEEVVDSAYFEIAEDESVLPVEINANDFYVEEFESGTHFQAYESTEEEGFGLTDDVALLTISEQIIIVGNIPFLVQSDEEMIEDESEEQEAEIIDEGLPEENDDELVDEEVEAEDVNEETESLDVIEEPAVAMFAAVESDFFEVTTDQAPVYDNRSGKLEIVGYVEKGRVFERYNSSENWHQILFGDFRAYVRKSDTAPASANQIPNRNNNAYKITNDYIEAREDTIFYDNSSGNLVPIATVRAGQKYPIALDYGGKWLYVLIADQIGFIDKNKVDLLYFPEELTHFTATADRVPIYDNRSGKLVEVGALETGRVYERYNKSAMWHQILFSDYRAYVRISETRPGNAAHIPNANAGKYKNQSYTLVAKQDTTIYDNSSGSLIPIGKINKGQEYPVALDYGGKWIYVLLADQVGYVETAHFEKNYFNASDRYFTPLVHELPVYNGTGGNKVQIGFVEKGRAFERLSGSTSGWHHIQFGNTTGYVSSDLSIPDRGTSIKNKNNGQYANQKETFTTTVDTPVYDNTSGSLVQMGVIKKGEHYPVALDYGGKWIYVLFAGQIGFVESSVVSGETATYTAYNMSLDDAVEVQLTADPQTDNNYAYVSKGYIENNRVTASALHVRTGPGTTYDSIGTLAQGTVVNVLEEIDGWYRVEYESRAWVLASRADLTYYIDPRNFIHDERRKFQFLDLSKSTNASATKLNENLRGKGTLAGQGQAFLDASRIYGVNDLYLVSHAFLETGHGTSELATGVTVNGVTVYNMFGVGAFDDCAVECGARRAYDEGWTTPYKAIVGGARFIGNSYITSGQNTLYKMRWDPQFMSTNGSYGRQYATDIGWAAKQVGTMYNLYQDFGITTIMLDIPEYR